MSIRMSFFWRCSVFWHLFSLDIMLVFMISCLPVLLRTSWETFLSISNTEISCEAVSIFRSLSNLLQVTEQIVNPVLSRSERARNWFSDSFLPVLFPALAPCCTSWTMSHALACFPWWEITVGLCHDHLKFV